MHKLSVTTPALPSYLALQEPACTAPAHHLARQQQQQEQQHMTLVQQQQQHMTLVQQQEQQVAKLQQSLLGQAEGDKSDSMYRTTAPSCLQSCTSLSPEAADHQGARRVSDRTDTQGQMAVHAASSSFDLNLRKPRSFAGSPCQEAAASAIGLEGEEQPECQQVLSCARIAQL